MQGNKLLVSYYAVDNCPFRCGVCGQSTLSLKKSFQSLPPCMILHIPRNGKQILKAMDLKVCLASERDFSLTPHIYRLSAAVCFENDHYFAMVKHRDGWHKIDDSETETLSKQAVQQYIRGQAVILFMSKDSTPVTFDCVKQESEYPLKRPNLQQQPHGIDVSADEMAAVFVSKLRSVKTLSVATRNATGLGEESGLKFSLRCSMKRDVAEDGPTNMLAPRKNASPAKNFENELVSVQKLLKQKPQNQRVKTKVINKMQRFY